MITIDVILKFNADVWGTVSDWVMVFVTTGTLLGLYFTLRSQVKVENIQLKLAKLEEDTYIRSIMPTFAIHESHEATSVLDLVFILTNNAASDLRVLKDDKELSSIGLGRNVHISVGTTFAIQAPETSYERYLFGAGKIFALEFKDVEGNTYQQLLLTHVNRPSLLHPQLIKRGQFSRFYKV